MGQPSSKDEMTIRHQFDRLCQMALKGESCMTKVDRCITALMKRCVADWKPS